MIEHKDPSPAPGRPRLPDQHECSPERLQDPGGTKKEGGGVKVPIRVRSPFSACVYLIEPKSKETVIDSTLCEMLTPKERKQRKRGIRVVGL